MDSETKDLNYYFAKNYFHPEISPGFKETLVELIIYNPKGATEKRHLLIQESNEFWGLPKATFKPEESSQNPFYTQLRNISEELGYKGMKFHEIKPHFEIVAYIYSFHKQVFDESRKRSNEGRSKGKIYHLAILHYFGPEEIPILKNYNRKILDYKWVNKEDSEKLIKTNSKLYIDDPIKYSKGTIESNILLHNKALQVYENIYNLRNNQLSIFD